MKRSLFTARGAALLGAGALLASVAVLRPAIGSSQETGVAIWIDASSGVRPISPLIYGVAHATAAELAELNAPLHRLGGNYTSRYNWEANAYNRGMDWYFESVGEPGAEAGASADAFIDRSRGAGAEALVTVPMLDWVARLGPNRSKLASFSIAKYGPQTGNDWQWFPDAGNGVRTTGGYVTGNDPGDANVLAGPAFQQRWIQHLATKWGGASANGVRYYAMDNEPSLWSETHRDVRPVGATMDEVRDRFIDYASMVKSVDPDARVIGPEEWGWVGYFYSGYDQQWAKANGWGGPLPDRQAHGGADYLPWLLDELRRHDAGTGRRLLDVLSVHYYPQGGEYSTSTTSTIQLRRNRSTRALWDPGYVDESWIGTPVQLIPRLRAWADAYAPGTPTAVTEYSWGAEGHISGAIAQADVLGIFGREGLAMAARWATPDASTPTFKAMKMYRNYDGNRSAFGDTGVRVAVPNPDEVAAFAALRSSDGALTVMVLNKSLSAGAAVRLNLAGFTPAGTAERWELTAANAIVRLADVALDGTALVASLPQQSITLFVVPQSAERPTAVLDARPVSGAAPLTVTFDGSRSSDPGGPIARYEWAFGDGSAGAGPSVTHTYTAPGTFTAVLTVTSSRGATATDSVRIDVGPDPTVVAAPTDLVATETRRVVSLQWADHATNETGFSVERRASRKGTWAEVGRTGANTTAYSEAVSRGTYEYRVRAVNSSTGQASGYSNSVRVRVR